MNGARSHGPRSPDASRGDERENEELVSDRKSDDAVNHPRAPIRKQRRSLPWGPSIWRTLVKFPLAFVRAENKGLVAIVFRMSGSHGLLAIH